MPRLPIPLRPAVLAATCLSLLALAGLTAAQGGPGVECDRLAASPNDPEFAEAGVEQTAIDGPAAREACRAAHEAMPGEPRYAFQLARAEQKLDNYKEAREHFSAAAKQGYPLAEVGLGILFDYGLGVDQDYSEAITHYKAAADAGIGVGLYNLAGFHLDGYGTRKDPARAAELYRKAMEAGYTNAAGGLANSLHEVWKDGDDPKPVVDAYIAAADRSIAFAHTVLGHFYRDGSFGLPVDPLAAMSHYHEGMQLGDDWATLYLSQMLAFSGSWRPENLKEAESMMRTLTVSENEVLKAQAMSELSNILAARGEMKEAASLVDAALSLEPDNSVVLSAHARLLAQSLEFEAADRVLTRAIEIDPDWAPLYRQRAQVQEKLGDEAEAISLRSKAGGASMGRIFLR